MSAVLAPPPDPAAPRATAPPLRSPMSPRVPMTPRVLMTWAEFRAAAEDAGTRVEWLGDSGETRGGEPLGEVWPVHGFADDRSYAMATGPHNDLVTNLYRVLIPQTDPAVWRLQSQAAEIACPTGRRRFPDFVAIRQPAEYAPHPDGEEIVLLNPAVVIEVLSSSTAAVDLGEKPADYLSVPSVTDYLIVDPRRVWVQRRRRADAVPARWEVETFTDPAGAVSLAAPPATLPLAAVYARVPLDEAE